MIGATAKADQFRERSGSDATKGSRKGFSLLGGGQDPVAVLSAEQIAQNKRASLVARLLIAQSNCTAGKAEMKEAFGKGDAYFAAKRRRDLAISEAQALAAELAALKPKRCLGDVRSHFLDVCRETMTRAQFRQILTEATQRANRDSE